MASCVAQLSLSGGSKSQLVKPNGLSTTKLNLVCKTSSLTFEKKSNRIHKFSVSAEYRDGSRSGPSGNFLAGILLGGAVFGAAAYFIAPKIKRYEDEYGFGISQHPSYYDKGLEKTRETLLEKVEQLNSAIDNVSSGLLGRKKLLKFDPETFDPETFDPADYDPSTFPKFPRDDKRNEDIYTL